MHHRAVILSAEHAPDDGVGMAKQFAAEVTNTEAVPAVPNQPNEL